MKLEIPIIYQQPKECGVACLQMVLSYYGNKVSTRKLIEACSTNSLKGGDWYFRLGSAAIRLGFQAEVITRTTRIFDPSWFNQTNSFLVDKLLAEKEHFVSAKRGKWAINEVEAAIAFLENNGQLRFSPISRDLIIEHLDSQIPVIAPVNANLIIQGLKRRRSGQEDDVQGHKIGHVVLVIGYDDEHFIVNDPGGDEMQLTKKASYKVDQDELVESVLRSDMHLLVIYQ